MDPGHTNHAHGSMSFRSEPTHERRVSDMNGTSGSGSGREEHRQHLTTNDDGSHESRGSDTHGMEYNSGPDSPAPDPTPIASSASPSSSSSSPGLTDADIRDRIFELIRQVMKSNKMEFVHCFEQCADQPPITPESLAELDMPRIINNPKLRHDVNFDRELHFRPNLDGSKGRHKLQQAEQYWKALEAEISVYQHAQAQKMQSDEDDYWNRVIKETLVRLPKVLISIRDILKTLVPDYDQKAVLERLDVDHMIQQIRMGVCDLVDLGNWLSKILKNHCAPMRDGLVDGMQREIQDGVLEGRNDKLVNGLRQLMTVLEAMKLDVANHQIRHMRPLLIDDTINFQRRYNAHRISIRKIDAAESKAWLSEAMEALHGQDGTPLPVDALVSALVRNLLFNDSDAEFPQAFYLDADRLRNLRTELHATVYHVACADVLAEILDLPISEAGLTHAFETLHSSVTAIVGSHSKFIDRLEYIAVEIVRVVLDAEGQHRSYDAVLLELVERKLAEYFSPASHSYQMAAKQLFERLVPKIQLRTKEHLRLTAIELQNLLVPGTSSNRSTLGFGAVLEPAKRNSFTSSDPDDDLVRRLAHILILHWQVWADLVYLAPSKENEKAEDLASENGSEGTAIVHSAAPSPTIPVAQAIYPPGKKYLPVGVIVTEVPSLDPSPSPSPEPASGPTTTGSEQGEDQSSSIDSQWRSAL